MVCEKRPQETNDGTTGVLSMSTRIWLNASATASLVKTNKKKWDKDVYTLNDVEVVADEPSGQKYISVNADPLDPAASMPIVARKHIQRVSYSDKYFEGFRADGLYRHKGATARVETVESSEGYGEARFDRRYQIISISAGSIKTLREIYTQVRQGKLKPAENWGVGLSELERRERLAAAKAAETPPTEVH
jgi:hypothetical protein